MNEEVTKVHDSRNNYENHSWKISVDEDVRQSAGHEANVPSKICLHRAKHNMALRSIASALFYGTSSFVIMLINKAILTGLRFPSAQFLGIGQMITTMLILYSLRKLKIITFPSLTWATPSQVWPLPIFYIGNLICGLYGTKNLSLPMFVVLRRFTILMALIGEFVILGTTPKILVVFSVLSMVFGAIVAASDDLAFDLVGYIFVISNDIFTAANGIYSKKKLDAKELGKYGLLYYNCMFMLGPAILLALATDDIEKIIYFDKWTQSAFFIPFLLSCIMGFVLMYSMLICTSYNTPLTTTIIGSVKNILVTYYGVAFGTDYIFSMTNFVGLNISAFGSLVYTFLVFVRRST